MSDLKDKILPVGKFEKFAGFFGKYCYGLLDENMYSGLKRSLRDFVVLTCWDDY